MQYDPEYMAFSGVGKASLALLSGVLLALAMPGFGVWPLVFVAWIPMWFAVESGHGLLAGLMFGVAFFSVDLRWMLTLYRFSPWVVAGFVLVVLYFSIPVAVLGGGLRWIQPKRHPVLGIIAMATAFSLLEIVRAQGPLGMGFSSVYLSLYRLPAAIQLASVLGPWSLSALVIMVNGSLAAMVARRNVRYALVAVLATAALFMPALLPIPPDEDASVDAAVVSSAIDQQDKLDARNLESIWTRYSLLAEEAERAEPQLIVFPESFLPSYVLHDPVRYGALQALARRAQADVLFGTGEFRGDRIYNSVVMLSPDGALAGMYDMVRPVPFGEYIPGRQLWTSLGLAPLMDSFLPLDLTPGEAAQPIGPFGTPICFESTLPQHVREFVRNGAQLLVVVTNDAWFGRSAELETHFAAAVFRAVENRRWLIQAANGGVSGFISPRGRVEARTSEEEVLSGSAELRSDLTSYVRWGDAPIVGVLGLGLLVSVAVRWLGSRRKKRNGG